MWCVSGLRPFITNKYINRNEENYKKLIRRWDSERELSLRRHCTRTTKYNRLLHKFRHWSFSATQFTRFSEITQDNGHYAVQGHSRSPILVPIESSYTTSYQVNQKKSPLRLLLILQQCMGIFVRNFTRLLSDQIYTFSPSFIEIFLELTKLHSFNHDNPHFTRWKLCCLPR